MKKAIADISLLWVIGFTLLLTESTRGQGTQADYDRMKKQERLGQNLVHRQSLSANWLTGSNAMWYRIEVEPRQYKFYVVEMDKKKKSLAFDHAVVAKLLGEKLETTIRESYLPFGEIQLDDQLKNVFFRYKGVYYQHPRGSKDLVEVKADDVPGRNGSFLSGIKPSGPSTEEININITNERSGSVNVYWIDRRGRPKKYAELKGNETIEQHTYLNHVWLVRSKSGRDLAIFEATRDGQVFRIDNNSRVNRSSQSRRSRSGQRRIDSRNRETSPNDKYRASIKNYNLVLFDIENKKESIVTETGTKDKYFRSSFYWSPDSNYLVTLEETPGQNRKIQMVESSPRRGDGQPKVHTMTYVKPGDQIRTTTPVLIDVRKQKRIEIPNDRFKTPWRIDQIRWNKDSSEFTFRYNQRGHQVMRIVGVSAKTGEPRSVIEEGTKTFIDYTNKVFINYLDETNEIIWQSERDGWSHLYLYDSAKGLVKNQITQGDWVVRRVRQVDREKRQIWFEASGVYPDQDPYYIHHCRVDFDGKNLVIMTQGDGTHSVQYSPDRKWLVDTYSRVDMPPVIELRETATGQLICPLEKADHSKLIKAGWRAPERFVAKGRDGKTDIHGVIYRPSNFDPEKKYPVIEYIYAGPHGSFVPKRFSATRREKAMTELGFIVVQIDGMGTSNRSKAFHDICWKNLGDSGFPDRILWMKAAAKKYPYMDLSRVGIFGGSAGGQSALRALLAFGDFYHVAVSDCGCHDNRMDKIWWNEQWMGWPIGPHYKEQSNVTQAAKLKGKLFLIVGELDRNVDPASTMQVVNALVRADKDFDLLVVPGGGHGVGSRPYGLRRTRDFFVRNLLGVEPRSK